MLLLLGLQLVCALSAGANIAVRIPGLGDLLWSTNTTLWTNRTIYQFQGIPFAKPPLGERRFKAPEPAEPWTGILNATHFRRQCPQTFGKEIKKQEDDNIEDCLYLNVYTNQFPGNCSELVPVMFFIHGGSFLIGSAHSFRPNYLLEQDVVLVVTQYRLGPLGFLSFQNDDISGNMGLLDMVLALEWVQKHISSFCGNSNKVTIFGQSSGGAAVSLLMASPLTKGKNLFQHGIIQSGSAFCDWAVDLNPVTTARGISKFANCTGTDQELATCLRNLTAYDILQAHQKYLRSVIVQDRMVVNGKLGGNHAVVQTAGSKKFLVEHPKDSYKKGDFQHIPTMIGMTKHEGTFFLGNVYDFLAESNIFMNNTEFLKNDLVNTILLFSGIIDTSGSLTDVFTYKFFSKDQLGDFKAMTPGLIDLCGMTLLKSCILQVAKKQFSRAPTYLYSFNFLGHLTKFGYGEAVDYPFSGGVAHSDDLVYLFPMDNGTLNEIEMTIAYRMVKLWTNFAAKGNPNPIPDTVWKPMDSSYGPYLRIDTHITQRYDISCEFNITVEEGLGEVEIWESASAGHINPSFQIIIFLLSLFIV
ncbi:unnamed protein product [Nezara viridula]|uniref:Carboxylesterase type B domain-containing protein n=2 Tax=Nezara viridula TaxID=85310 RepID=A0A9P0E6M2_NEZVI|nr:unnamed protein product [Nezara viridula]